MFSVTYLNNIQIKNKSLMKQHNQQFLIFQKVIMTGSGKTFTILGNNNWKNRGITPRTITKIFQMIREDQENNYNIYISCMEIYNEQAFDILNKNHMNSPIDQWQKLQILEDEFGQIHCKQLSLHQVVNEQEALDLMMMSSFIRQQSSTPQNEFSSRSHMVFTITIEGQNISEGTEFVSKLNLVDLAGSERISEFHLNNNTQLKEAKNKQVIIALNEKNQNIHIPYRNSLMTTILKDSLGGNCKTVMIANISAEQQNYEESLCTLRFATRVGKLENEITKNQKIDLNLVIKNLQEEKNQLKKELSYYKNNQGNNLNSNQNTQLIKSNPQINIQDIVNQVDNFISDKIEDIQLNTQEEVKIGFQVVKELYNTRMKDYIQELMLISDKLMQYDHMLNNQQNKN